MKKISVLMLLLITCVPARAQKLTGSRLDSVYYLYLHARSYNASGHHAVVQSIDTTHIKCSFGLRSTIRANYNSFTASQKAVLQSLMDRPTTDTSIVTPGGFFRVHFTKADTPNYIPNSIRTSITSSSQLQLLEKEYLDSLAIALDSAYNFEVNYLGYPAPPSDNGAGGDDKYDIYISNLGSNYGETDPESDISSDGTRYTSYMLINGDYSGFYTDGINAARVTVAHEFHHAIQIGNYIERYDLDGFFYELTSTSMEHFVYPTIRDYVSYLPAYFNNTQNSFGISSGNGEYALAIWNIFLKDNFGYDIIKKQWELMPQMRALQAIANSIADYKTSFGEQFNKFGIWTFYTNYRTSAKNYFEDAIYYPTLLPVANIRFSSSSSSVQLSTGPVTNSFIAFYNPQNNDTVVSLISNADIDKGINNLDTSLPFTYNLYNFAKDGSTRLTNSYYESFSADQPAFWVTSAFLNNQIVDSSSYVVQNSDYVFPMPFSYKKNAFVYIPANPDTYGYSEMNIYNTAMKLVYSTNESVIYYMGHKVLRWNGIDNHNNKLSSGVYIYVTKSGSEIKKGKLVIFND